MRSIGLILITIGFLGGALVAVLDPAAIRWLWFVPCLVLGAVGVVLVQVAIRAEAMDVTRTSSNFAILTASLGDIVKSLSALDSIKESVDVYELPQRIDSELRGDISSFVDARQSIAHVCGTQAYADVMSHFAAGERYLNRVWSCAADGYIDEAHAYIGRSREQFAEALERLQAVVPKAPPEAA
jgi:hypothetical protein